MSEELLGGDVVDLKDLMARCYLDSRVFGKTIFPERFTLPFSKIHAKVFEALDSGHQKIAIAAPRGFGKTTMSNLLFPAKKILFQDKKFIVPISNTNSQAVLQSENLKRELLGNGMVTKIFGPMKSDWFSKEMWITSGGTAVFPRGAGQQVRGVNHNGNRPDLIILDDFENAEDVRNEETRKKLKEWFFADVMNSVDRSKDWQIVMVGTVLHEDSLLENLLNDPTWFTLRLEICDDEYRSNWPDLMSDAAVKALAESYRAQGMLDVFYREYRNIPISTEDAIFMANMFKYYEETDEGFVKEKRKLENLILVDPARSVKMHSAESAIVGVGLDVDTGRIYVRDVDAGMYYPDELYDRVFDMANRLNARAIGLEVTGLHEFITFPFKNEMLKRGETRPLIELKARGKKEERIAAMVPFYRNGYVYHNKAVAQGLESQLLTFPRCKRFDIIDALAYFVEMLDIGNRFFTPEFADEDEFAGLDEEPLPVMNNWRICGAPNG